MQVNITEVNQELQSLKPANRGAPDPVSKLWPNHYSATVERKHEEGCTPISAEQSASNVRASKQNDSDKLKRRFPEYYSQYGYG